MKISRKGGVVAIIVVIVIMVISAGVYMYKNGNQKTETAAQLFNEASLQLGFTLNQLTYFGIFGHDRIQYSFGSGTNYAYKVGGTWYLAGKGNHQDVADCTEYASVPEQYNPGCFDKTTGQSKYMKINTDGTASSVNYPPSEMVSVTRFDLRGY